MMLREASTSGSSSKAVSPAEARASLIVAMTRPGNVASGDGSGWAGVGNGSGEGIGAGGGIGAGSGGETGRVPRPVHRASRTAVPAQA